MLCAHCERSFYAPRHKTIRSVHSLQLHSSHTSDWFSPETISHCMNAYFSFLSRSSSIVCQFLSSLLVRLVATVTITTAQTTYSYFVFVNRLCTFFHSYYIIYRSLCEIVYTFHAPLRMFRCFSLKVNVRARNVLVFLKINVARFYEWVFKVKMIALKDIARWSL